jgi:hypothetical protein
MRAYQVGVAVCERIILLLEVGHQDRKEIRGRRAGVLAGSKGNRRLRGLGDLRR